MTTVTAANSIAHQGADLALRVDGSLVLAGGVTYFDGRSDIVVARYLGDAVVPAPAVTHVSEDRGRHDRDAITNDQTLMIFGTAVPGAQVDVFRDGQLLGTVIASPSGDWSFDGTATVLSEGQYDFSARARVGANTSVPSESLRVIVDLTPPPASIPKPTDTGSLSTDNVTRTLREVTGTAEADSSVELWLDSVQQEVSIYESALFLVSVAYASNDRHWKFSFDEYARLTTGTHTLRTRTTDLAGNSTDSANVTFQYVTDQIVAASLSSVGTISEDALTAPFAIVLSKPSDGQFFVGLQWSGTATAGTDFTALSQKLVVPGLTSNPLNVLLDDTIYENDKTLTVEISSLTPVYAFENGIQIATVTITENDAPTLSDITDLTTPVGVTTSAIPFVLGNFANGVNVPVAATSSNTLLVPNGNIVLGGNGANRTLTITPAAGRSGQATISITAGHGAATVTDTFVLTVGTAANRPTISPIDDQVTSEDVSPASLNFTIGDDDTAAGNLTVVVSSSNTTVVPNVNLVLGGSGANRTLAVTPAANAFGTTTITVVVTDSSGMSASEMFDLQVDPINDAPSLTSIAQRTTDEDAPTATIAITVSDVDNSTSSLTLSAVSSDTSLVLASGLMFSGSGANRTLVVTPAANQSGMTTITVTVLPDNDAPSLTGLAPFSINEDSATHAIPFVISDLETNVGGLTISATSSNSQLVPNDNLVFGGSGSIRTITATPAANQFGVTTITVTVSEGLATTSDSFELTVHAVNDRPTVSDIANQTIAEDTATRTIPFSIGDVETEAGDLTVTVTSSNGTLVPNGSIVLGGSGASRTLVVMPAANQNGTTTITVQISDGSATASDSFALTVNPVNDPPTLADISNQSTDEDVPLTLPLNVVDVDTANLTVTATSSNTTLVPATGLVLSGTGANRSLKITPAANRFGTTTITVQVNDGSASVTDTFLLTVNSVNDPPTISSLTNKATNEDTPTSPIAFTIGDIETAVAGLSVTATSSNTTLVPNASLIVAGTGANRTIKAIPAANLSGTTTITVAVTDGTTTSNGTFLLTVNPVNDAPTISDIPNQSTRRSTQTAAIPFTISDLETSASSLIVSGSSSNTTLVPNASIVFGGSGSNRTLRITPALNRTGTATITVRVRDGSLTASDTFVLTVSTSSSLLRSASLVTQETGSVSSIAASHSTSTTVSPVIGTLHDRSLLKHSSPSHVAAPISTRTPAMTESPIPRSRSLPLVERSDSLDLAFRATDWIVGL